MNRTERIEAAQKAVIETHRLDVVAARTGDAVDIAAAENHFQFVETPCLEAAYGQGQVNTRRTPESDGGPPWQEIIAGAHA